MNIDVAPLIMKSESSAFVVRVELDNLIGSSVVKFVKSNIRELHMRSFPLSLGSRMPVCKRFFSFLLFLISFVLFITCIFFYFLARSLGPRWRAFAVCGSVVSVLILMLMLFTSMHSMALQVRDNASGLCASFGIVMARSAVP